MSKLLCKLDNKALCIEGKIYDDNSQKMFELTLTERQLKNLSEFFEKNVDTSPVDSVGNMKVTPTTKRPNIPIPTKEKYFVSNIEDDEDSVKIIRAANGYMLEHKNENGMKIINVYEEKEVKDTRDIYNYNTKEDAEALVKLFWDVATHFGVTNSKHNKWLMNLEVVKREEE